MSFLSHIGLSVVDKLTGNALDKLGNAIKDGDVTKIVEQFTSRSSKASRTNSATFLRSLRMRSPTPRRTFAEKSPG